MMSAQNAKIIRIRAAVNKWLMSNFTEHRKYLQHEKPAYDSSESLYTVVIVTKDINGHSVHLGELGVDERGAVIYADNPVEISKTINRLLDDQKSDQKVDGRTQTGVFQSRKRAGEITQTRGATTSYVTLRYNPHFLADLADDALKEHHAGKTKPLDLATL